MTLRDEINIDPTMSSALAMKRSLGRNSSHVRRNFSLSVLNGTLASAANDFLNPELILAGFVYAVTNSAWAVALVTVLNKAGVLVPQLIVGNMVEPYRRRRPVYATTAVIRFVSLAMMFGSMVLMTRFTGYWPLLLFYGSLMIHAMGTGAGIVVHNDMVGRLIPHNRIGTLLAVRRFLGGICAITVSFFVVQPVLNGYDFPSNYLRLAVMGGVLVFGQLLSWSVCSEQPGHSTKQKASLRVAIRRGLEWLRTDWNYRCFMWISVSFRFSYVGLAFFIPYGTQSLGYSKEVGGIAVLGGLLAGTRTVSDLLGGLLWTRLTSAYSLRATLVVAAIVTFMAPVMALLAGHMPSLFEIGIPGTEHMLNFPLVVFLLSLACVGAGFSGLFITGQQFLITQAPPEYRPSYMSFISTFLTPLTLLPLAGAFIASAISMDVLFILVAAGAFSGVIAALRMRP